LIRGVSEEGEDLTDLIPSMEKLFNSVGLTLKENETTFKSTYDIIKDLSSIWETLTDMKRANILESVAGENRPLVRQRISEKLAISGNVWGQIIPRKDLFMCFI
jgi:hypothetical protein